jgi:hypothetical protein
MRGINRRLKSVNVAAFRMETLHDSDLHVASNSIIEIKSMFMSLHQQKQKN